MFPQLIFGGIPVIISSYLPMDWWYCKQNGKLYARSEVAIGRLVEQLSKAVEDHLMFEPIDPKLIDPVTLVRYDHLPQAGAR